MIRHADLVVSHGGNGTIYQALSGGKPVIGIPFHIDQEINLQRVESLGTGIKIPLRHYGKKTLTRAVAQVMSDPGYLERAKKVQAEIESFGGASLAAKHVHEFAEARLG